MTIVLCFFSCGDSQKQDDLQKGDDGRDEGLKSEPPSQGEASADSSIEKTARLRIGLEHDRCEELLNKGKHSQALQCGHTLLSGSVRALELLARVHRQTGNLEKAREALLFAEEFSAFSGSRIVTERSFTLARYEYLVGLLDDSLSRYYQIIDNALTRNEALHVARARSGIGRLYNWRGDPDSALVHFDEAAKIFAQEGDQEGMALNTLDHIRGYILLGSYKEATTMLRTVEAEVPELISLITLKPHVDLLRMEMEIRRRSASQGIVRLLESIGNWIGQHRDLSDMDDAFVELEIRYLLLACRFYRDKKSFEAAQGFCESAQELSVRADFTSFLASSTNSLGLLSFYQGEYREAFETLKKAAALREKMQDQTNLASIYMSMGASLNNLNLFQDAINVVKKAVEIEKKLNMPEYTADEAYLNALIIRAGDDGGETIRQSLDEGAGIVKDAKDESFIDDPENTPWSMLEAKKPSVDINPTIRLQRNKILEKLSEIEGRDQKEARILREQSDDVRDAQSTNVS